MKIIISLPRFLLAMISGLMIVGGAAHAYTVSPLVVEMDGAPGARTTIRIENTKSTPITLEVVVNKRSIAGDGTEKLTPAPDDFIILPPQTIVQPGKVQNLRIQYLGDPVENESAHYRVTVAQLPVQFDAQDNNARAQMVLNFGVAVHLSPRGAKEQELQTAVSVHDGALEISLTNANEHHFLTGNKAYTLINANGDRHELIYSGMARAVGVNVIPGQSVRTFEIPAPEGFTIAEPLTLEVRRESATSR